MHRIFIGLTLLLSLSVTAQAEDKLEHGDWSSQFQEEMGEATTHENGRSLFGMLCATNSCRYYFANGTECESSATYPLMITTNEGALAIDAVCESTQSASGDVMLYWFNETDSMSKAFHNTPVVGFAFPLTNGQFKTSIFSMNGFNEAVDRVLTVMRERVVEDKPNESASPSATEPPAEPADAPANELLSDREST